MKIRFSIFAALTTVALLCMTLALFFSPTACTVTLDLKQSFGTGVRNTIVGAVRQWCEKNTDYDKDWLLRHSNAWITEEDLIVVECHGPPYATARTRALAEQLAAHLLEVYDMIRPITDLVKSLESAISRLEASGQNPGTLEELTERLDSMNQILAATEISAVVGEETGRVLWARDK